ncbi:DNA replication and repair protein RecN [Kordia periserrulae]|uniref:DNA repair protein RecN n=1 Tax=Kordia periserrulae TaxID=701523 RepID=A0A2T6BUG7_9FLAO|nr:DNA repair protein RecN [Kordia periserrulae]PTX59730.1 DNA replication and repair protein RecN [Kordia periserrulae]
MLTKLSIKNFALIDALQVDFDKGLTIITGETGAGKSILLGGLALILGKRADLSSLKDKELKCVIEAEFSIKKYQLTKFFTENDLDYDDDTIIRREILPSGKSRAFVNDVPVRLDVLNALGDQLIDIHSQHQTLQLTDNQFQFQVIDILANVSEEVQSYQSILKSYHSTQKELKKIQEEKIDLEKEYDYNMFLLKELEEAKLEGLVLDDLEAQYERLNNAEDIKTNLSSSEQILSDEQVGVLNLLSELQAASGKLAGIAPEFKNLAERIKSSYIELDDIYNEIINLQEEVTFDPELFAEVSEKLQKIFDLQKKHQVLTIEELLSIQHELSEKASVSENIDTLIQTKEKELQAQQKQLQQLAKTIHDKRAAGIPTLVQQLESMLATLGMPNAQFDINVQLSKEFYANGMDDLQFLFSANKGGNFNELKKAASGGELSRVMLCIKAILSKYMQLQTIMFDEIDTGVSGEVANKMANIMQQMSKTMQVFSITHLPQIAAKGKQHFKVYKQDINEVTSTQLKELNQEERIQEIAQMLSGATISDSALANAKELLQS